MIKITSKIIDDYGETNYSGCEETDISTVDIRYKLKDSKMLIRLLRSTLDYLEANQQ